MTSAKDTPAWAFNSAQSILSRFTSIVLRQGPLHNSAPVPERSVTNLSSLQHEISSSSSSSRGAMLPFITVIYPYVRPRGELRWGEGEVERLHPSRQTRQGFGLQPEQEMGPSPSGGSSIMRCTSMSDIVHAVGIASTISPTEFP